MHDSDSCTSYSGAAQADPQKDAVKVPQASGTCDAASRYGNHDIVKDPERVTTV